MKFVEFTMWVMADGQLWEGVGYFRPFRDVVEGEFVSLEVRRCVRKWAKDRESIQLDGAECFVGPFEVSNPTDVKRLEAWIDRHCREGGEWLVWAPVMNRRNTGRAFHGH